MQAPPDKTYAGHSPVRDDEYEDDDDINDFDELPCEMSYSATDRSGLSRIPNGQYGSMQISTGLGGSSVSSPAEESPETTHKRHRYQTVNNGTHYREEYKARKTKVRYRECQKNHAASLGGHAVDGCGEFLPGGKEGTLEALQCAACSCHRNFHRREFDGGDGVCTCGAAARSHISSRPFPLSQSLRPMSPVARETKGHWRPSSADIPPSPHMVVPLAQYNYEDDDDDEPPQNPRSGVSKKKRFRTKFTSEQKQKMMDFAEQLGWKILKQDEDVVQEFCEDVNVKRNVFKVWMHNNKHLSGRKLGSGSDHGGNCDSPPDY